MANDYLVIRRNRGWFVEEATDTHGPYLSRRDALADALDVVESRHARDAVMVKDAGRNAVLVWRQGRGQRPDVAASREPIEDDR